MGYLRTDCKKNYISSLVIFLSLLTIIASFVFSLNRIKAYENPQVVYAEYDIDAPYHVLLMMHAFAETPAKTHKFLPLVTLGNQQDKNIPWGMTAPDKKGNYYYTSFPPLAFALPYWVFTALHINFSLPNLLKFNLTLKLFFLLLVGVLSLEISKKANSNINLNRNSQERYATTFLVVALAAINFESMYSYSVSYWAHQLFQIFVVANILFLFRLVYLRSKKVLDYLLFSLSIILMFYTEWSAYVYELCLLGFLSYNYFAKKEGDSLKIAGVSVISAILPVLIMVVLFSQTIGLATYVKYLHMRQEARSHIGFGEILSGYWLSYSWLLFLGAFSVVVIAFKQNLRKFIPLIILLVLFCVIENYIMEQHVVAYSFDRLKFQLWILLAFIFLLTEFYEKVIYLGVTFVLLFSFVSLKEFSSTNLPTSVLGAENNSAIVSDYLKGSPMVMNWKNRGYTTLLFNQNVQEDVLFTDYISNPGYKNTKYVYLDNFVVHIGRINAVAVMAGRTAKQINLWLFYSEKGGVVVPKQFVDALKLSNNSTLEVNFHAMKLSKIVDNSADDDLLMFAKPVVATVLNPVLITLVR